MALHAAAGAGQAVFRRSTGAAVVMSRRVVAMLILFSVQAGIAWVSSSVDLADQ